MSASGALIFATRRDRANRVTTTMFRFDWRITFALCCRSRHWLTCRWRLTFFDPASSPEIRGRGSMTTGLLMKSVKYLAASILAIVWLSALGATSVKAQGKSSGAKIRLATPSASLSYLPIHVALQKGFFASEAPACAGEPAGNLGGERARRQKDRRRELWHSS